MHVQLVCTTIPDGMAFRTAEQGTAVQVAEYWPAANDNELLLTLPELEYPTLQVQKGAPAASAGQLTWLQDALVSAPKLHVVAPDARYPLAHVGWHDEPLARVVCSLQVPMAPLIGADAFASQGLG